MTDLLTVLFLILGIISVVSAKKYEKKELYIVGVVLFIAFLGVFLHEFSIGFAEGFIRP